MAENNRDEYEQICMMCRRPESITGKMINLPGNLTVCTDCMQRSFDTFGLGGMAGMNPMDMGFFMNPQNSGNDFREVSGDEAAGETDGANEPETAEDTEKLTSPDAEVESDDDSEEQKPDGVKSGFFDFSKMGGIPVINLSDFGFGGEMPGRKRVKKKKKKEKKPFDRSVVPAPHKIKAMLDEYVVGQEKAKKAMSVAVYNHYKRIGSDNSDGVEIEKSNMLMLGPTGSGKTYLVKTLAKLLDVPLAIADATSLTEAGYIGDDIESVVSKLLAAADNDVDRAEHGIIYIDEIDKIAKKKNQMSRDVSGESVQQELLKMLEGSEVEVPVGSNSKNAMVPMTTVNTDNILFICGGAFPELEEIIKERLTKESSIGFRAALKDSHDNDKNLLCKAQTEDLRKFGMIPEFLGRLPVLVSLESLTEEFLVRILKEPKNAILKQYKKLLAMDEVQLEFDDDALLLIAKEALKRDTGARGLRAVLEEYMQDIMYEIPKDDNIGRVTITKAYIEKTGGPAIAMRGMGLLPGE